MQMKVNRFFFFNFNITKESFWIGRGNYLKLTLIYNNLFSVYSYLSKSLSVCLCKHIDYIFLYEHLKTKRLFIYKYQKILFFFAFHKKKERKNRKEKKTNKMFRFLSNFLLNLINVLLCSWKNCNFRSKINKSENFSFVYIVNLALLQLS